MPHSQAELRLPAFPGCDAILICAYSGHIGPGSHQMRVLDGGWTAWLPVRGTVRAQTLVGRKWFNAKPGQALLLPSAPRDHELTTDTRMLSVRFRLETPNFPMQVRSLPPIIPPPEAVAKLSHAGRSLVKSLGGWLQPSSDRNSLGARIHAPGGKEDLLGAMEARAAFASWIATFFKTATEEGWPLFEMPGGLDPVVARALEVLTQFDGSADGTIAAAAAAAGVSPSHLRRLFHQNTGTSPAVFRDQIRQHEAERRLSTSRAPLKEIAYDLGFASPSHFTNWFRARTGQRPSAHRANARLPGV